MQLKFRRNKETGNLHVDGIAPCGAEFSDIAVVIEPESSNPGLQLKSPLGFRAVRSIIENVEEMREGKCQQLN